MEASLIASALRVEDFPPDNKPEIAFAGRSNVGKSSLINALVGRRNLAHTSKTPGKTQCINFYEVERKFYFVDLPGYGYARTSMSLREKWGVLIPEYLRGRKNLRAVVQLIDSRHPPMPGDRELFEALRQVFNVPVLLIATKSDKLTASKKRQVIQSFRSTLNCPEDFPIVLFSCITGEGKTALWHLMREKLR